MTGTPRRCVGLVLVWLASLGSVAGCAGSPPLARLDPPDRDARLEGDRAAVRIYRAGLQSVVDFAAARPDLFPAERPAGGRLLGREDREAVRRTWQRFLDYLLALDAIGRYYQPWDRLGEPARELAFVIAHAAFVAQYRFALDFLDRLDRDPGLDALLNEPVPELGLPAGTYARVKLRFLNAARATEFAGLGVLAQQVGGSEAPELRAAIAEDRARIWHLGRERGEIITAKHALHLVRQAGFAGWFPVQAGSAQWMAQAVVWRKGRALIAPAQFEALLPRLEPGDILLVRRTWYLSDIGLPGFWPHAALYVGTPEERRRDFADPEVQTWVRGRGQPDGDLKALLRATYPEAYERSIRPDAGRPRRVLEAISEGVVFHSLEHLAADSLAVLRPRLSRTERAAALIRALSYVGRPYDFDFDFRTDAAIVCTELVYKAYEPAPGFRGLAWSVPEILGRPVIPANEFARQFDAAFGTPAQQLDLVVFLDGQERAGVAIERPLEAFQESWRRPNWPFVAPKW